MWDFLPWVLGLIGVVGVGGTIALFIFAPAVAGLLVRGVGAFIATPIGAGLIAGAACLFFGVAWGDYHGRTTAEAACAAKIQTMQQQADDAALQRDQNVGVASDVDAQAKIIELATEHKKDQEAIDVLRNLVQARSNLPAGSTTVPCYPISDDEISGNVTPKVQAPPQGKRRAPAPPRPH